MLLFGYQKPTTSDLNWVQGAVSTIHNGIQNCLSNLKAEMGFSWRPSRLENSVEVGEFQCETKNPKIHRSWGSWELTFPQPKRKIIDWKVPWKEEYIPKMLFFLTKSVGTWEKSKVRFKTSHLLISKGFMDHYPPGNESFFPIGKEKQIDSKVPCFRRAYVTVPWKVAPLHKTKKARVHLKPLM